MLNRNGTLSGERPSWPKASLTRLLSELKGSALTRARVERGSLSFTIRSGIADRWTKKTWGADDAARRRCCSWRRDCLLARQSATLAWRAVAFI